MGYALPQGNGVVFDGFVHLFVCDAADGDRTVCFAPEAERCTNTNDDRRDRTDRAQTGLLPSVSRALLDRVFDFISGRGAQAPAV